MRCARRAAARWPSSARRPRGSRCWPALRRPPPRCAPRSCPAWPTCGSCRRCTATSRSRCPRTDELALRRSHRRARVLSVLVAAVSVVALALGGTVYSLVRQQQAPVAGRVRRHGAARGPGRQDRAARAQERRAGLGRRLQEPEPGAVRRGRPALARARQDVRAVDGARLDRQPRTPSCPPVRTSRSGSTGPSRAPAPWPCPSRTRAGRRCPPPSRAWSRSDARSAAPGLQSARGRQRSLPAPTHVRTRTVAPPGTPPRPLPPAARRAAGCPVLAMSSR